MNRVIGLIIICSSLWGACTDSSAYKITGTLDNVADGDIFLVTARNNQLDTLARAEIVNGSFMFTGTIDSVVVSKLVFKNQREEISVILEQGEFSVREEGQEVKVEGGREQTLYNHYKSIENDMIREENLLDEEYYKNENDSTLVESVMDRFDAMLLRKNAEENKLLRMNPDAYVSAYIVASSLDLLMVENFMLVSLKRHIDYEQVKEKYMLLGEKAKATGYGRRVGLYVEKQEKIAVGAVALDFTVITPEEDSISLSDIKGRIKLIDFWASWCGPCRQENPCMVELYKKFHEKGLEIFSISLDSERDKWVKAIQEDGLIWKQGSDLKGWESFPVQLYSISCIPYTILLDENNKILAKGLRGEKLREKMIELLDL